MRSWKVRPLMALAMLAMVLAVSLPAMAQVDEFGDAEVCTEVDLGLLLCDGELFAEADDLFDAEEDALEAELEEEEAEAEADAEDEGIFEDDGIFDDGPIDD